MIKRKKLQKYYYPYNIIDEENYYLTGYLNNRLSLYEFIEFFIQHILRRYRNQNLEN